MRVSGRKFALLFGLMATVGMAFLPIGSKAQISPGDAIGTLNQGKYVYDLSVSASRPHIVEFTPIDVTYTVIFGARGPLAAGPAPDWIEVCPALIRPETPCAHIAPAVPGRTYRGTIKVMAPRAGAHSELRVVALIPGRLVAEIRKPVVVRAATVPLDVFARYEVAIEGFNVMTTRSTSIDTDWVTLQGLVTATPPDPSSTTDACHLAGITWCIFRSRYGDAGDGYHAVHNVRVGPYDLIPEVQNDLRFLYDIDNTGDNPAQAIGEGVANGFSKVGEIILMAYGAESGNSGTTGFAGQLDGVMEKFHAAAFASCDGPVADDLIVITNRAIPEAPQSSLDALTWATGVFRQTAPTIYQNTDGDFRCDRRGAHYRVTYAVYRTSWVPWASQFSY